MLLKRELSLKLSRLNINQLQNLSSVLTIKIVITKIATNDTSLTKLNLANAKLNNHDLIALSEALRKNYVLTELDLSNNAFDTNGLNNLLYALYENTHLKKLTLSNNKLKTLDAILLAEMLLINQGLTHIILTNNEIDLEGLKKLKQSFDMNNKILHLDLTSTTNSIVLKRSNADFNRNTLSEFIQIRDNLSGLLSREKISSLIFNTKAHLNGKNPWIVKLAHILFDIKFNMSSKNRNIALFYINFLLKELDPNLKLDFDYKKLSTLTQNVNLQGIDVYAYSAFSKSDTLNLLNLQNVNFLALGLQTNSFIKTLNVATRSPNDNFVKCLFQNGIKKNDSIRELVISTSKITQSDIKIIVETLSKNSSLRSITLHAENIDSQVADMFAEINNYTLLKVVGINISDKLKAKLSRNYAIYTCVKHMEEYQEIPSDEFILPLLPERMNCQQTLHEVKTFLEGMYNLHVGMHKIKVSPDLIPKELLYEFHPSIQKRVDLLKVDYYLEKIKNLNQNPSEDSKKLQISLGKTTLSILVPYLPQITLTQIALYIFWQLNNPCVHSSLEDILGMNNKIALLPYAYVYEHYQLFSKEMGPIGKDFRETLQNSSAFLSGMQKHTSFELLYIIEDITLNQDSQLPPPVNLKSKNILTILDLSIMDHASKLPKLLPLSGIEKLLLNPNLFIENNNESIKKVATLLSQNPQGSSINSNISSCIRYMWQAMKTSSREDFTVPSIYADCIYNKVNQINIKNISPEKFNALLKVLSFNENLKALCLTGSNNIQIRPLVRELLTRGSLESLDLTGAHCTIDDLQAITQLQLKNLTLSHNKLDNLNNVADKFSSFINQNPNLEGLFLVQCTLNAQSISAIISALRTHSKLKTLDLSLNPSDDYSALEIGQMLETNTILRGLGLFKNNISPQGLEYIVRGLSKNSTLKTLYLSGNNLGIRGAGQIAKLIEYNSIETLTLHPCGFNEESLLIIAKALANNISLKRLNLVDNQLSDQALLSLLRAIQSTKQLSSLSLRNTQISHLGFQLLAEFLEKNDTLLGLILSGCKIDKGMAENLAKAIRVNGCLRKLHLSKNTITEEAQRILLEALKDNYVIIDLGNDFMGTTNLSRNQYIYNLTQSPRNRDELLQILLDKELSPHNYIIEKIRVLSDPCLTLPEQLKNMLIPYKHQELQKDSNLSLLQFLRFSPQFQLFIQNNPQLKQEYWEEVLERASYLKKIDISIIAKACCHLQNIDDSIDATKSRVFLRYKDMMHVARLARSQCRKDERELELQYLDLLISHENYHPEIIAALALSPVFYEVYKKQFGDFKQIVILDNINDFIFFAEAPKYPVTQELIDHFRAKSEKILSEDRRKKYSDGKNLYCAFFNYMGHNGSKLMEEVHISSTNPHLKPAGLTS